MLPGLQAGCWLCICHSFTTDDYLSLAVHVYLLHFFLQRDMLYALAVAFCCAAVHSQWGAISVHISKAWTAA